MAVEERMRRREGAAAAEARRERRDREAAAMVVVVVRARTGEVWGLGEQPDVQRFGGVSVVSEEESVYLSWALGANGLLQTYQQIGRAHV